MDKRKFKKLLSDRTLCTIQHNGWTCGTCFFSMSKKFTEQDWQSVLLYRGDYKAKELTNLPKDYMNSIDKVFKILNEVNKK